MRRILAVLAAICVLAGQDAVAQTLDEAAPQVDAQTNLDPAGPAPKQGLFALFAGDPERRAAREAARAARKEARIAAREARKQARAEAAALRRAKGGKNSGASMAHIETAVAYAVENKPKGRWWCVPFARMVSGIDIRGNAKTWWEAAKGRYSRGQDPKVGAVMAFAASRAMPKGHVAVVSKVVSDREVLVVHANWERARVTLHDLVIDVSDTGDWSRVRVANQAGSLGRVNPVNGFIYNG